MSRCRVVVDGLDRDQLRFAVEIQVQLDSDSQPVWTPVQTWTLPNPYFTLRERTRFLDQAIAGHGWAVTRGRRPPAKNGRVALEVEPVDWDRMRTEAAQAADRYRRVETAWHHLMADSGLPPIEVGTIAGFSQPEAPPAA